MSLLRRVIIALFLTVIFGLTFASMTYGSILASLSLSGYIFFCGGIPASILIDKYVEKEGIKLIFYLISGFIIGMITITCILSLLGGLEAVIPLAVMYGFYGLVGNFLFCILMFITIRFKSMIMNRISD